MHVALFPSAEDPKPIFCLRTKNAILVDVWVSPNSLTPVIHIRPPNNFLLKENMFPYVSTIVVHHVFHHFFPLFSSIQACFADVEAMFAQSSTIVSTIVSSIVSMGSTSPSLRRCAGCPEPADVPTSSSRASVLRREAAPLSEPPATELVVFGAFCMASMAFRSTQNEGK